MKRVAAGLLVAIALFAPSQSVSAHVLVTDTTHTKGAIVHIMPDDNPVAGKEATVFFDMQGEGLKNGASVELVVRDANKLVTPAPVKSNDTVTTAAYTFPTPGVYDLLFTVKQGNETTIFEHSQYVAGAETGKVSYVWAETLLVVSGVLLLVLGIVAFNRRKTIAGHSTV